MNEISAAMGLTGLESFDDFVAANELNYRRYRSELDGLPGVRLLLFDERERCNFQYVVLEIDEAVTSLSRDQLLAVLHAENVLARRYFYPGCHRLPPYRADGSPSRLTVTEALANQVLVLPTGTAVSPDDVGLVCEIVRLAVGRGGEVREGLLLERPLSAETPLPAREA
jgi:dTDP-4-amino-4,6-dideoxygalactose transaminase